MAIGLSCCLSTLFIPFPLLASVMIALTSAGFMLRFPLVLHVHKAYLSSKRQLFFNRSRRALIFQLLVFCLFVICEDAHMAQTISLGLLACAFSRAIAVAQQKRDGILRDFCLVVLLCICFLGFIFTFVVKFIEVC